MLYPVITVKPFNFKDASSIIPILLTIYGYSFLYDYSGGNLFTELVVLVKPSEIVYSASVVLLIVGGVVGMFGSVRAVRKFLKV